VLELDNLLSQVALSLNTERATGFIEQFGIERLGQRSGSRHHQVKTFRTFYRTGQDHEQANTRNLLILDIREIEAARFNEARSAEDDLVPVVAFVAMKDAELAVPHADATEAQYEIVPGKCSIVARNDA